MKTLPIFTTLVTTIGLLALSSSLAAPNPYVFGSSGANLSINPGFGFALNVGAGTGNVFGDIGVRGDASLALGDNSFGLGANLDLVLPLPQVGYTPYFGGGLGANLISVGNSSTTSFNLQGLVGVDFPLNKNNNGRIFIEAVPQYFFSNSNGFALGARAGLKLNL